MFWPCKTVTDTSFPGVVSGGSDEFSPGLRLIFDYSGEEIYFFNLLKWAHVIYGIGQELLF